MQAGSCFKWKGIEMINDCYALKKWTHRISFFYCAAPLGHFCHVPWDFLCKFSMLCRELLFRNLLDQIWSQTDASCGSDPLVHTFTDPEHRLSTFAIPGTLHCTAVVYLALRHCSHGCSNKSCLEKEHCCLLQLHFLQGIVHSVKGRGTLRNWNNTRNKPFFC